MRRPSRFTVRSWGALLLAAAIVAVACNVLTGESKYSDVSCTASGIDSCMTQCSAQGGVWNANASACECGDGNPPCGSEKTCCGADGLYCSDDSGSAYCQPCDAGSTYCGYLCCPLNACLNGEASVCGATFGQVAQSCAGGLTCPVPSQGGTIEMADCCESIPLSGALPFGRSLDGNDACPAADLADGTCQPDELPEVEVTLSPYHLDRFEVTVGRFRAFVEAWDYQGLPAAAGANVNVINSGWDASWNASLPSSKSALLADLSCATTTTGSTPALATWTSAAGANEQLPINCVTWFEAFAFCAWDGGRLPTEAEWELAAANGSANDLYPWGEAAPSPSLAVYDCTHDVTPCATAPALPANVGSRAAGASVAGHRDLAGNVLEWTRDDLAPYSPDAGADPFFSLTGSYGFPMLRGGAFNEAPDYLRAAARASSTPGSTSAGIGFRCARNG
jgi:formylglycine-generating enzyme required for sulfatase activity